MAEESAVQLPGVMWHVTVTLHGQPQSPGRLRRCLDQLAFEHGLGLSARYTTDTVELRYWDEGQDCRVVADHGLLLWDEHRESSQLPSWAVVGLEVLDRPSFHRRWPPGTPGIDRLTPGVKPLNGQG